MITSAWLKYHSTNKDVRLTKKSVSRSSIEKLIDNGNVITDKTSMAELLNTFFIDYPKNLISNQSTHEAQSPSAVHEVGTCIRDPEYN